MGGKMKIILQPWVTELGLRHQGTLLTAIRGCDTSPKEDSSKALARSIRAAILNTHCDDPRKAVSFIEHVSEQELGLRMTAFRKNCDHYPHHYIMHVIHAVEIIAYKKRTEPQDVMWLQFYFDLCRGLHLPPETEEGLDSRLNADEMKFGEMQK
jgi:hypothetical protein